MKLRLYEFHAMLKHNFIVGLSASSQQLLINCDSELRSCGKISEDPRRRELYRLWLARNCHFINNFVPLLLLATDSNMDIQAVTTKFGVIEYMTKYITKSQQGSLVTVMMDSFAKCMEKAQSEGKGVKSATAKFFNLATTQDAKCQLETMHLTFRLPRCIRSRDFGRLKISGETRKLLKPSEVTEATVQDGKVTHLSDLEYYLAREDLELPGPLRCDLYTV